MFLNGREKRFRCGLSTNSGTEQMSAIQRYSDALEDEFRVSNQRPVVAIVGRNDFEALRGELLTLFNLTLNAPDAAPHPAPHNFTFKGIAVYKSYAIPHGFFFG